MYDIIIVSIPYTYIGIPPLAPAVLKGAVESENLSAKTIDLGMELFKLCDYDQTKFERIQEYFITDDSVKFSNSDLNLLDKFLNDSAKLLVNCPSRYIGISIFSYFNHSFAFLLLTKIKQLSKDSKIVIGGAGAIVTPGTGFNWGIDIGTKSALLRDTKLTSIENMMPFGKLLMKRGLVDYQILGDGEEELITFLKNRKKNKTTKKFRVDYKKDLPYANFDDYALHRYPGQIYKNQPQIPIFGSKGCVRNCDFCDVPSIQGKFRFRIGKNIFNEIVHLADKHNIRDFNFTDSLVNGNLSSFLEWVNLLAEYNRNNPDKKITWNGSWICRPIGQMSEELYVTIAESGCESLSTGIETGSNDLLKAINKKTNVEAYRYEFEQFSKYNVKIVGLFIVGHWAETWEDFLQTCDLLYKLIPYSRNGTLVGVNLGGTGLIHKDTPVDVYNKNHNHIKMLSSEIWWNEKNPSLTAKEKFFRLLLIRKICEDFKIIIIENSLPLIYTLLKKSSDQIKEFFSTVTEGVIVKSEAQDNYYNYDAFLRTIINRNTEPNITIELKIECQVVNQLPKLQIKVNDQILSNEDVLAGTKTYKFTVAELPNNSIDIKFHNKSPKDTIIDKTGNIIKDTCIKIDKFLINGIDISGDPDFFYNYLTYTENNQKTMPKMGFWIDNSVLHFNFSKPFYIDFTKKTSKNLKYAGTLVTDTRMSQSNYETDDQIYTEKIIEILENFPC